MKNNGNNCNVSEYFLGLDVGTNSVGWAATDESYSLCRFRGNSMWGIRLFDEAMDSSARRTARTSRRRTDRRKQRLELLELLFNDTVRAADDMFFIRMKESSLCPEDKHGSIGKYALFNNENFTDKDYLKKYPSIYHLRSELIHSEKPHDVRLVYLAIHHILKNRGHFLFEGDMEANDLSSVLDELIEYIADEYETEILLQDRAGFEKILVSAENITAKKKQLRKLIESRPGEEIGIDAAAIADILAGATVKLSDLFDDDELKNAEKKSVTLKADIDADFDALSAALGNRIELIIMLKKVFDVSRLSQILGSERYISDAKIALYNKNGADLRKLKKYVREYAPDKYKTIFSTKRKELKNYAAYSGYKTASGDYSCNQEDFCSFLKAQLPNMKDSEGYEDIWEEICSKTFLTKLKGTDNGVIPQQLNRVELKAILENASGYLPLLKQKDTDGLTVAEKILSLFDFRIPYYVGPLNTKSPNSWVVRSSEKIYPWNFEKVVDVERSAQEFITRLIGRCTYTGEYVLPVDSLLYSEFMVLNEINLIKVNGEPIPVEVKKELYNDLFVSSNKKVTKKGIKEYLLSKGLIGRQDEISGVDDIVKSKLKSYHDFRRILEKTSDRDMVEEIIKSILVYGEDKKMLRRWLKRECKGLDDSDITYICRLRYKDWGRLSREFLTGIFTPNENGEPLSIMDMLWNTNCNLMQLLTSDFMFAESAKEYRSEKFGGEKSLSDRLDEMYISPSVRRSLRQTLRIVDEIVDIRKSAPKKIFIEVARGSLDEVKGKRTESRKDKLIQLYKACKEDSSELFERLNNEPEDRLRSDKLYLYYTQFGKCMYSGESIDISALLEDNTHYDIDHIFPRSRVKDNSIDNRVLVRSELNREKTNDYPIRHEIREKMYSFWKLLRERGLISEKKFTRLTRNTPLTEKELSEFVARQVIETQQSTKALASLMSEYYPNTKIVYSKAGNVSDFRQRYELNKCRDVNDLHHAKDAYLNIVVGNVYDTKFTAQFFKNISRENYSLNKVFDYDTAGAWKADGTSMAVVKKALAKNNVLYTRMPHEVRGQLFDLQIMPAGQGQLPIKQNLPIERYGGYNKLSGAYFCAVEHTVKKKRVRTIEPVYVYKKEMYEADPLGYCREILHLVEPKIIAPIIRMDSLLEINGMRLYICGRTNNQLLFKHAYQLAIDAKHEAYIKTLGKYIERCDAKKEDVPPTKFDGITEESTIELYDWMFDKFHAKVYAVLFKNVIKDMEACREKFILLSITDQCRVLLEILKAFKCDRQNPNVEKLNGKKSVGIVILSKSLSNADSAALIDQSVTGLYEYRTDLLGE